MILPKIINAGVYRNAQKSTQIVPTLFLGLYLKGLIKHTTYAPDGTVLGALTSDVKPSISLTPPGFRLDFEYGPDRENWVIMLSFPAMKYNEEDHQLYWNYNGVPLAVPRRIELNSEEIAEFSHRFRMVNSLYASALPRNLLEAELNVLRIMERFIQEPHREDDMAELFRKQLDDDQGWNYSITEHCARLGVNRDRLREKFFARYKIEPGEYRAQMRLRKIRHLLAYSDLTLKEIAFEIGMKNLSHLSGFVRQRCGKSPSQLRREYRRSGK